MGHARLTPIPYCDRSQCSGASQFNEGQRYFTGLFVWNSDHSHVGNISMLHELGFYFRRCDIFAANLDQILARPINSY
jgi:hypothetical protein